MFCYNCGTILREGARFCTKCGQRLEAGSDHGTTPATRIRQEKVIPVRPTPPERVPSPAIRPPVRSDVPATNTSASTSLPVPLLALDGAALAVITLTPWIGTSIPGGTSETLPGLALDALNTFMELTKYSGELAQYGLSNFLGYVGLIALVAGGGWILTAYWLVKDLASDYKGKETVGNGFIMTMVLSAVTWVVVRMAASALASSLGGSYFDPSMIAGSILSTTVWVFIAFAIGCAGWYVRRQIKTQPVAATASTPAAAAAPSSTSVVTAPVPAPALRSTITNTPATLSNARQIPSARPQAWSTPQSVGAPANREPQLGFRPLS